MISSSRIIISLHDINVGGADINLGSDFSNDEESANDYIGTLHYISHSIDVKRIFDKD